MRVVEGETAPTSPLGVCATLTFSPLGPERVGKEENEKRDLHAFLQGVVEFEVGQKKNPPFPAGSEWN